MRLDTREATQLELDPDLDFEIAVREDPDCTVIVVTGELDMATAPELQVAIAAAVERRLPIVVDTSRVTFMDSTGLAGLLALRSDRGAEPRTVLQGPGEAVMRILELTGITGVFEIAQQPGG